MPSSPKLNQVPPTQTGGFLNPADVLAAYSEHAIDRALDRILDDLYPEAEVMDAERFDGLS